MTSAFRQSNGIIQGKLLNDKIDETKSNVLAELSEIEKITVKPHIVPTGADPFIDGQDGDAAAFAALSNHPEVPGVKLNAKGKPCYYTKIRGSKPIPVFVGSVEGLEDIDFDSLQEIEDQEGPNGEKVYAVDGRSHIRAYGNWLVNYNEHGNRIMSQDGGAWIEVTSFSNALMTKGFTTLGYLNDTSVSIDGIQEAFEDKISTTTRSPLIGRFSDPVSLLNTLQYDIGLRTITFYNSSANSGWLNQCYGIRIGVNSPKENIFPQKCVAQGKVFQVGYGEEDSLPDVWEENYGQPGYNGEYDDFQDWGIGEAVIHAITNHTSDSSQFTSQPLNIYEWIVNTAEGKAYRLLNPFLVSGIHQATSGTHCNWSDPKPYVDLPVTGEDVVAGQLYYSATYSKLYKCIVSGRLNYLNQTDIEASGLFAREIPINGGVTAWVCYDGIVSPTNRARVTRWIKKKARHIGNTDIDERANGQQRPVFEAGDVDFSKHELAQVLHWRQFGNGDENGEATPNTGFDTFNATADKNVAYTLDDGLTSLVGKNLRFNGYLYGGVTDFPELTLSLINCGLRIKTPSSQFDELSGNIISDLPTGTHVFKFYFDQAYDTRTRILILCDNTPIGELPINIKVGYFGNPEFQIFQIKLPDLPENSCIISKKNLLAEAVSPTEAGNRVIGKGVRRCHATRDVFYDQSSAGGIDWRSTLNPDRVGGWNANTGNAAKDNWCEVPFIGELITIRPQNDIASILTFSVSIDGNSDLSGFKISTGGGISISDSALGTFTFDRTDNTGCYVHIGGLTNSVHSVKVLGTTAVGNYFYMQAFDMYPKIHRYNHYKTTHHPHVQPEFLGGGDGIDCDDLIVHPDGEKSLDDLRRPHKIEIIPGWSIGLSSGHLSSTQDVHYNFVRGVDNSFSAKVDDCVYVPGTGEIIIVKPGVYMVSVNNLQMDQSGGGGISIFVVINGKYMINNYSYSEGRAGEHTSMHCQSPVILKKGDRLKVRCGIGGPDLYGVAAFHANFSGLLIQQ